MIVMVAKIGLYYGTMVVSYFEKMLLGIGWL